MRIRAGLVLTASVLLGSVAPASAEVQLTIQKGRVTLVATKATLGEILDEWERVGQTRIINRDQVSGTPITLELTDVPESQALGILLRSVNGYIAAPRAAAMEGLSRFDRVMIMPGTPAPRVRSAAPSTFLPPPDIEPSPFDMPEDQVDAPEPADERPVRTVPPPASPGTVFGAFPRPPIAQQPDDAPPRDPASPAPSSSQPTGVSVPGMIVPGPPADREPAQGR